MMYLLAMRPHCFSLALCPLPTGLLLLTNDNAWINKLTHPKYVELPSPCVVVLSLPPCGVYTYLVVLL